MSRPLVLLLLLVLATPAVGQDLVDIAAPTLAPLPESLGQPLPVIVDGETAILGGWIATGDSVAWSQDGFLLDESGESWSRSEGVAASLLPNAAVATDGNASVVVGGFAAGGWSSSVARISVADGVLNVAALPDLPAALEWPAAMHRAGAFAVAGFDADNPTTLRVFSIPDDGSSSWTESEALPDAASGPTTLAFQNEGLFVATHPVGATQVHLYRRDADGWEERARYNTNANPVASLTMGQAHIGFLIPEETDNVTGSINLVSYSTVTNEWAYAGHTESDPGEVSAIIDNRMVVMALTPSDGSGARLAEASFEVGRRQFYFIDYAMVVVYLLAMILIGFYFSRREKGTDDFFVGGRRMPWWAVGFSLYATGTSAISFMAIPAKSYATDWLYLTQNVVGTLAIIPVALVIVPLIRRLSLTSTYEYLGMRFHVIIRIMGSILAITYQLGARMSVVLFLPALALSAVTGVGVVTSILFMGLIATLYTVLGGIKAVIWTDVVQVVVLLGGALLCLIIIVTGIDGGVGGLLSVASADAKMHMFDWRLDLTIPTVWLFVILATADTITWPRDQVMVQRVLSTKSAKEAGFSVWTLGLIVIPGSVLFFSLGTALYGFYKLNPEKLSPLLELDATFPFFIAAELPAGLAGLIIAALFAASMSTLDSSMNSVSTIIVVDFFKRFKKNLTDRSALIMAKWITVITGVFGTAFALVLSRYSLPSLWDTFIMLTGLLGGGFGGVYTLGMFTRRANWQGALVGIVSSIFVTLAVRAYTNIHVLLYAGVAIISCIVIGYIVSLFFPMQERNLEGLTVYRIDNPNGAARHS